ncbi:hypothetical protein GOP47_0006189 [Adiantum capillus-veneris]|uniref:Uncharacterized protein n=1 Tax=Adiantum capillus-veneris TaxID=13818 RepID=A0A9D4ZK29_ADICA|nr:hypothetical protein GOP47_0006189 [Adiantum capillus-veneris]
MPTLATSSYGHSGRAPAHLHLRDYQLARTCSQFEEDVSATRRELKARSIAPYYEFHLYRKADLTALYWRTIYMALECLE